MDAGLILIIASSAFYSITVMADKLMVGDFYLNDPKLAWIISSVADSSIGIFSTLILWLYLGPAIIAEGFLDTTTTSFYLCLFTIVAGVFSTLSIRCYFELMARDVVSASVSIAVATTPIFIFAAEILTVDQIFTTIHYLSFTITIIGLLIYEYVANPKTEVDIAGVRLYLTGLILIGAVYVLLIDEIFFISDKTLAYTSFDIAAILFPYYWLGFGIGHLYLFKNSIRKKFSKIFARRKFLYVVLILEIIGTGFFFFEFLGLTSVSATLVALIVGAHVVFVWVFDMFVSKKYRESINDGGDIVNIAMFNVPIIQMSSYDLSLATKAKQLISILLVLIGLWLWPGG